MPKWRLESDIQAETTRAAVSIGLLPIRINVVGRKGWPDYGYGYKGHMCFIEFKRPGERPEPLQEHVHQILRAELFPVFVVSNADYGITLLKEWKHDIDASETVAKVRP